jgi:hypothetical protein
MAETQVRPAVTAQGWVAFYRKPEPLSAGPHGKLGIKRNEKPFGFAKGTHLIPITIGEFASAGLDYPIIFTPDDYAAIAVMGLVNAQNVYIRDDGSFEPYRYIPAFIRRYPFVFAEDKQNQRFIACIDVEAPMVAEGGEIALFSGAEPTQFTKDAVSFLTGFEQQRRDTQAFTKRLAELDLFETRDITVTRATPDGGVEPFKLGDYIAVSQTKLSALPDATVLELHKNGMLGAIYVHLHSLRNWERIIQRANELAIQKQAAGVN